ncbi:hypothetical protein [uncultured Campylobacter sp.]|nr:hypothetical protein [uncultured Campylobacter sp.]
MRRFTPHLRYVAAPHVKPRRAAPRGILRNIKTNCVDLNLCGDEIL